MISIKELAKKIKAELKTAFPGCKFSVSSSSCSVKVFWKDGLEFGATTNAVKGITQKYEVVRYGEEGDILQGGNTYVSLSHDYSKELLESVEKMVEVEHGAAYGYYDYWHEQTQREILNLEAFCLLSDKPPAEEEETVYIQSIDAKQGLEGVMNELEVFTAVEQKIYGVIECDGDKNKPFAQAGGIINPIYFGSIEALETALKIHSSSMGKDEYYHNCWFAVTLPDGTVQKFNITLDKGLDDELNLKHFIYATLNENKTAVEKIVGDGFQPSEYSMLDVDWYTEKIEMLKREWYPETVEVVTEEATPEEPDTLNYVALYENRVQRLIASGRYNEITSFDVWVATVKDLLL